METLQFLYTITLLPGIDAIAIHEKDNKFTASSDTAMQMLYYRDRLALYPAKDLPELRFQKTEDRKQITDDG